MINQKMKATLNTVVKVCHNIVKHELQYNELVILMIFTPLEVLTINYIHFIVTKLVLIHTTIRYISMMGNQVWHMDIIK